MAKKSSSTTVVVRTPTVRHPAPGRSLPPQRVRGYGNGFDGSLGKPANQPQPVRRNSK